MLKVLILHGWHGSDEPHWQAWLAQQLALENCIVAFPQFSDNQNPDKAVWVHEATEVYDDFRPDVVVAHSLGNILWFHMCRRIRHRAKKLLLCAPPRILSEFPAVDTFFPFEYPMDLMSEEMLMVASDNDPYLSLDEAKQYAKTLDVELKVIEQAGHINASSGFGPWPWVKEWVLA